MKLKKYRIVADDYNGYECQCWRLWFPFWIQMTEYGSFCNSFRDLSSAKAFISNSKQIIWKHMNNKIKRTLQTILIIILLASFCPTMFMIICLINDHITILDTIKIGLITDLAISIILLATYGIMVLIESLDN